MTDENEHASDPLPNPAPVPLNYRAPRDDRRVRKYLLSDQMDQIISSAIVVLFFIPVLICSGILRSASPAFVLGVFLLFLALCIASLFHETTRGFGVGAFIGLGIILLIVGACFVIVAK